MRHELDGCGPALILLHGVGLDHTMWRPLAKRLAPSTSVFAFDLLGHGEAAPIRAPATLEQFTAQLWSQADHQGIDRFDLCGFSMGAMIAQRAALERPGRIRKLILMSGVHRRSDAQRSGVTARLRQARDQGPRTMIEAAIERWFTPSFRTSSPEVVETIKARLRNNDPQEFLKAYAMFAQADGELAERSCQISNRTLVVTGELDTGSTPAMTQALATEIPAAQAVILPGLAHMAPVEEPNSVAQVLLDFLANGSKA